MNIADDGDNWAEQVFDPDDLTEITAHAERIVNDDGTWIELALLTPSEGAREFIDTYEQAQEGNIMAMFQLLTFLGTIAESLQEGLDLDATPHDQDD